MTIETLIPVGIITAILFTLTVILLIADKYLVSYGDCTVTVEADDGNDAKDDQGFLHDRFLANWAKS